MVRFGVFTFVEVLLRMSGPRLSLLGDLKLLEEDLVGLLLRLRLLVDMVRFKERKPDRK